MAFSRSVPPSLLYCIRYSLITACQSLSQSNQLMAQPSKTYFTNYSGLLNTLFFKSILSMNISGYKAIREELGVVE